MCFCTVLWLPAEVARLTTGQVVAESALAAAQVEQDAGAYEVAPPPARPAVTVAVKGA